MLVLARFVTVSMEFDENPKVVPSDRSLFDKWPPGGIALYPTVDSWRKVHLPEVSEDPHSLTISFIRSADVRLCCCDTFGIRRGLQRQFA